MKKPKPKSSLKSRVILGFLKVFGLVPFTVGAERKDSRISKFLSVYNIALAIFILINAYTSEQDSRNDANYSNMSFLIGIAYDAIDVFGNLYISYSLLWSIFNAGKSISAWFRLKTADEGLSYFNIAFDHEKLMLYMCFNISFFLLFLIIFPTLEIILCARLKIFYTPYLWITNLAPLIYNTLISLIFGPAALAIFQRYWAINNILKEMADNSVCDATGKSPFYHSWDTPIIQPREILPRKKKPPFYIMLKEEKKEKNGATEYKPKRIKLLKETHFELFQLIRDFNSSFGFHFLFQLALCFSGCTINLYFAIIFHLRYYEIEEYISALAWTISFLSSASYVVFHANLIVNEARRTTDLVHMCLVRTLDEKMQKELNTFSTQLMQCPVHITAGGFFEVNSQLLFQFLTGVLSSVVFVVQFDKVNFPSST